MNIPNNAITRHGYDNLIIKLEQLQQRRTDLQNNLREAIAQGDLSENAAVQSIRQTLSSLGVQIIELREIVANAVIAETKDNALVGFGTIVALENQQTGKINSYTIVGNAESAIDKNLISIDSPLSSRLLGSKVGDIIKIGPKSILLKILSIGVSK